VDMFSWTSASLNNSYQKLLVNMGSQSLMMDAGAAGMSHMNAQSPRQWCMREVGRSHTGVDVASFAPLGPHHGC
jgi:hypothetical protein